MKRMELIFVSSDSDFRPSRQLRLLGSRLSIICRASAARNCTLCLSAASSAIFCSGARSTGSPMNIAILAAMRLMRS